MNTARSFPAAIEVRRQHRHGRAHGLRHAFRVLLLLTSSIAGTLAAHGSITVIKDAVPDDPQDFRFTGDLGKFSLDDDTDPQLPASWPTDNLLPGTYTVTEEAVAGWALTDVVITDPDGGSRVDLGNRMVFVDLDPGERITVTFTNTKLAEPEVDVFPHSVARLSLTGPSGAGRISFVGSSRIEVYVGPQGEAEDTDGDGRDDAAAEIVQWDLRGHGTWGPARLRLVDGIRTAGSVEELVNATKRVLDVRPFAPTGMADSFFDVYAEIEIGGQRLHPAAPLHMTALLDHKPPRPGVAYTAVLLQPVPLLDGNNQPSGFSLVHAEYIPATTVEVDVFTSTEAAVIVERPDGGAEGVRLTGRTTVCVYFEGAEGEAADHDGNGRDDVLAQVLQLDLAGTSSAGAVAMVLAGDPVSLGGLEETANATAGILDIRPFAPAGACESFFDVFFELVFDGQAFHNAEAWRLAGSIAHKPPAAGEVLASPPDAPLILRDGNGQATRYRLQRGWHVPSPPQLHIELVTPAVSRISWPSPSSGYYLEGTSNMPPALWEGVTNAVQDNGERKSALRGTMKQEFFRLRRPLP